MNVSLFDVPVASETDPRTAMYCWHADDFSKGNEACDEQLAARRLRPLAALRGTSLTLI